MRINRLDTEPFDIQEIQEKRRYFHRRLNAYDNLGTLDIHAF